MAIYITGDTHGDFTLFPAFCHRMKTTTEDIMIVLGDAGLNYYANRKDQERQEEVSKIPITFFCIHGNHEMRPEHVKGYQLIDWHGGKVWQKEEYPNILFAKDGEIYEIGGKKVIVIGGAYSVDKYYRLARGYRWFEDEQPSEEIKKYVEEQLERVWWKVDVVLSHTSPYRYEPREVFLPGLDQSTVDDSTERWLDTIEEQLEYEKWYCGHFHTMKKIDKLQFMYHDVDRFD